MTGSALVTGASSGIGREFARLLARRGHDLVITARRAERLQELALELRAREGVRCLVVPADLADPEAPERLFATVTAEGWSVDVLVNNAGVVPESRFLDRTWAEHEADLRVMTLAPLQLVHAFLPGMLERGRGVVINVGSVAAWFPSTPTQTVYGAAKVSLVRLTRTLAEEYRGRGVTFTVVCPGATRTEMVESPLSALLLARIPGFLVEPPRVVAERGWAAAAAGRTVVIGGLNGVVIGVLALLPESLTSPAIARWLCGAYDRMNLEGHSIPRSAEGA